MKLLFDQNLSHRLVGELGDLYPDSAHVRQVGLERAPDRTVWDYARSHGFTIVSKDTDFHELSVLLGCPPKVVWIRRGNCATAMISAMLRDRYDLLDAFSADASLSLLILL